MAIKPYQTQNGERLFEVYLNAFDPSGKRIQFRKRGLTSLREAKDHEFKMKRELADRCEGKGPRAWVDWHRVCIEKMRLELRPSTVMNYEGQIQKWVNPVWKEMELQDITANNVHNLIYNRIEDVSPHTRRSLLKMLKRLFQMAIEEELIDRNPSLKIKVKVPEAKQAVLNATEANRFLHEARRRGHPFYEIWAVALFTGMRSGELYALQWSDVDFESKRIKVARSWSSKTGFGPTKTAKSRVVPISVPLDALLKELKLKGGKEAEFVLPHLEEWTRGEQAYVTREFCEAIGVTPIKFHDLRATFITQLLLKGVSLAQVMAVVGHSEIKTTNAYLRVAGSDLGGVTDRLGFDLPAGQPTATILEIGGNM